MALSDRERNCIVASLSTDEFAALRTFLLALKAERQQVSIERVELVGSQVGDQSSEDFNLPCGACQIGIDECDDSTKVGLRKLG